MGKILDTLFFIPSVLYTAVVDKAMDRNWHDRIDECVILGALPLRSTVRQLVLTEDVKGILSMNEDFELNQLWYPTNDELQDWGVQFLQLPVADYVGLPSWNQVQEGLTFINGICGKNATVYIHCKAGRFRSATMAATYLMNRYNMTPEWAENTLRAHRKQVWMPASGTKLLRDFYDRMQEKAKSILLQRMKNATFPLFSRRVVAK